MPAVVALDFQKRGIPGLADATPSDIQSHDRGEMHAKALILNEAGKMRTRRFQDVRAWHTVQRQRIAFVDAFGDQGRLVLENRQVFADTTITSQRELFPPRI